MPYDMPMSLDDVLADEERRRAAASFLGGVGGAPLDVMPKMPAPEAAAVAPDNFEALARRYAEAQQQDAQQRRENALAQGAGSAAETILGGQGVRYARGPAPREPDAAGDVLRSARAQAEIAKMGRPAMGPGGKPSKSTDPNSPESKRGQDIIRANLSDQYTEEEILKMTEADVSDILKYGSMKRRDEVARENEVGRDKRFTAQQMQQAKIHAENLGYKWADMGQDERLAWARIAESKAARESRADEATKKRTQTLAERNVGGFTFDEANPPSAEASKKMAEAATARDELLGSLDILEAMYQRLGSEQVGEESGTMSSEWMNITNLLRKINEMGVPNGADYLMLGKQIEDPTTLQSITTSKRRGLAQMKTLRSQIQRKMEATAKALKFRPEEMRPSRAPAPSAPPSGAGAKPAPPAGDDLVRVVLNGKPKKVPRQNLEALKKLATEKRYTLEIPNG